MHFYSLNIEYIFGYVYDALVNLHLIQLQDVSSQDVLTGADYYVAMFIRDISLLGLLLSVCLFILLTYVRVRIIQVEHAGFHHREEKEIEKHTPKPSTGANARWDMIIALVNSPQEGDWRRALIEADSMLDKELADRGYPGGTIGEKLKLANPLQFTTLQHAWDAHKVRNAIAHLGEGFPLTERDAKATVELYRRVFEELGVI